MLKSLVLLLVVASALSAPTSFAQSLVAETQPLTADEQLTRFRLPPGFEIQLVAQEPDVHKPMNMKFDARGRLWVSHSLEYPFPAANDDVARDSISVLSDFAPNGRARKAQQFASGLNIPIGVLPLGEEEAIAWSIPNIYRLTDSNSDGVADKKSVAFGPFGVVDTHGNQNAFTRWIDGWAYANHGFSNDSRVKVAGRGTEVLHMHSGNTYRFRPDGSAIEQYSWGQVNPFGLSFDPLGNLYSADCHSSAVSLLLRGGYYQSFGKPHDGLGFAPVMTNIDHGGTGIAGVAYSTLPDYPPEFRDVLFVGNVITNRVHCDRLEWFGSTPVVEKVEDFLTCDEPWFRPVDLQVGPDGALYIADFYNCVIGHYEVPLTHPKRDRERGRIWRVIYTGKGQKQLTAASHPMPDLHTLKPLELFSLLAHPNLAVRVLATNRLVDECPEQAAAMASDWLATQDELDPSRHELAQANRDAQACHAIWILQRTVGVSERTAARLLETGIPGSVQVHLTKALGETADWRPWHFKAVRTALASTDPFVRRAAAEALSTHPSADNVAPLLSLLNSTNLQDAQLYHQVRIAIRNQISSPALAGSLLTLPLDADQKAELINFAVTAPIGAAAILIFDEALKGSVSDEALLSALPAAAKHVDANRMEAMVAHIEHRFQDRPANKFTALRAIANGLLQRELPLSANLRAEITSLIQPAILDDLQIEWRHAPLQGDGPAGIPWVLQQRPSKEGGVVDMISSLSSQGERAGGILQSPTFTLPVRMSFWMCGHNGLPSEPDRQLNFVRLVLEDGTEVARSYPPRNDTAHRFDWDLTSHVGQRGHIEVVDGTTDRDGFAWLAVSKFEPSVSLPSGAVVSKENARAGLIQLAGQLKLEPLRPHIQAAAEAPNEDLNVRLAATNALIALDPGAAITSLSAILADPALPDTARAAAAEQLGQIDLPAPRQALLAALPSAPRSLAIAIAASVAAHRDSAESLLQMCEDGDVSPALLREPVVLERLKSCAVINLDKRVADLTAGLEAPDDLKATLIAKRRAAFLAGKFDPDQGRAIFARSVCASCHRVGSVGSSIGPALDGIGNRGLDRLLEDTLDPDRNVDPAFRAVTILTDEGRAFIGFGVREEGKQLVFNDDKGAEIRVPLSRVEDRTPSALSPMPSNVADQMSEHDYYELLAYLLSLKQQ